MTTPTPTLVTMNSKWQGSRFITSRAPGMITTSPCHCLTCHLHFHHHLHTLAFTSEVSLIPESVSSTSQTTSTTIICSSLTSSHHLSVAPSTTHTSYLKGKFPHLFFFIFYILIILSTRSTATTPPHHHYQYQPTPNEIGSRRVCVSSLRFFFFFFHLYCNNVYLLSPPNMSQWAPHLDDCHLTSTPIYPAMKRARLAARDVSQALGRFFFFSFFYDTNIYLFIYD